MDVLWLLGGRETISAAPSGIGGLSFLHLHLAKLGTIILYYIFLLEVYSSDFLLLVRIYSSDLWLIYRPEDLRRPEV